MLKAGLALEASCSQFGKELTSNSKIAPSNKTKGGQSTVYAAALLPSVLMESCLSHALTITFAEASHISLAAHNGAHTGCTCKTAYFCVDS